MFFRILTIVLFITFCRLDSKLSAQTDTIYWRANEKLSWADFRGSVTDSTYNAVSVTEIKPTIYYINESYILKSESYFLANESYKKNDWMNEPYWHKYGLQHEQIHFDIDHFFALTLDSIANNKLFSINKITEYRIALDSLIIIINNKADSCQMKYDKETSYGLNQGKQQEWKKIIDDRILYLLEFNKKWYDKINERTPKIK